MQTFIANLKHAIYNKETVTLGGGQFSPEELREVADAIQALQDGLERIACGWSASSVTLSEIATATLKQVRCNK